MSKKMLLPILFFVCANVFASATSFIALRALYIQAATSKVACTKLLKLCNEQSVNADATILGHKACATMMMAKYYFNPISKLNAFNDGKKMLETAINKDISNTELRYLRFTIQNNSPSFLAYNKNLKQDKLFLTTTLPSIQDEQLKSMISNYLKTL